MNSKSYGFVTIATGDEQYYKIAYNLLRSYRRFAKKPLPFAIIADRENDYTAQFDDVRLFEHAKRNYLDKLEMFDYLPYDINIFIDADCLAYGDLNRLFDIYKDADDFSCFGRVLSLDDKTGWFEYENLGDLKETVSYIVGLHGGIYYMRKTEKCRAVFDTAKKLVPQYKEFKFKGKFDTPGDEPLVALSMAINKCKPITYDLHFILCYWEFENKIRLNIAKGIAETKDGTIKTDLLHWGTRFTKSPLYRKQIEALSCLEDNRGSIALLLIDIRYAFIFAGLKISHLIKRVWNKGLRILHLK